MNAQTVTVIGLGNPHMGDDGVGVALVEMLREEVQGGWAPAGGAGLQIVAAGADCLLAGAWLAECSCALLVDAAEMGARPGEFRFFSPEEASLPGAAQGVSPHVTELGSVLEMLRAAGAEVHLRIMAIQHGGLSAGSGLSPALRERLGDMLQGIKQEVTLLS